MLPAYVPNPVAAATGGGALIDGGGVWKDGKRIFGDGKTVRGFCCGIFAGVLAGAGQIALQGAIPPGVVPDHTPLSVVLLATGALLGDLVKSFFKRRRGMDRGTKWPVADMYDLVAGSLLLALVLDPGWVLSAVTLPVLVAILILTPVLHRGANLIGYMIGVKKEPW